MFKKLFDSKKAVVVIASLILEVLAATDVLKLGAEVKEAFMGNVAIIAAGFGVGQGIADHGKEKAKVEKGQA